MAIGRVSTNGYATARFIVDTNGISTGATHSTIASALTDASSGQTIFIRPGTYTENLTLKAGVNLAAYECDSIDGNVTISGNCTATFAGTCDISGIRLQTNSGNLLTVSGSSATVVNIINCYLNCTNNTGISFTSSSSSAIINVFMTNGDVGTTGIAVFSSSSAGNLQFRSCGFTNSGLSTTANTCSAGTLNIRSSYFFTPITTSSTCVVGLDHSNFETNAINTTALTLVGGQLTNSYIASGTAIPITVNGSATQGISNCAISSSNATAISGSGIVSYVGLEFVQAGTNNITTTTRSASSQGTFIPTILGSGVAGTTTYTTQAGFYTRIDDLVTIQGRIVITGATGTGDAVIGGFPFAITNTTSYDPVGTIAISSATWTLPAGTTYPVIRGNINTTNSVVAVFGSATGGNLQMNNSSATFLFNLTYRIS